MSSGLIGDAPSVHSSATCAEDAMQVAVIGVAGRFPRARNISEFWDRLACGSECISFFTDAEFLEDGGGEEVLRDPYLVKAGGLLENAAAFDAAFFGYAPREAELMDPQQRIFLQIAYACMENAGYNPWTYQGAIGVYAGASLNRYLVQNVLPSLPQGSESPGAFQALVANSTSSLATRISYELNLRGPSVFVQSACSTSLLAIHLACQDLLGYRCDMALAGGVSVNPSPKRGYRYVEDGVFSPDGRCRAFDGNGRGTVPGSGAGAVLIKRLEDAVRDGDLIRAVIKGSAANNDGATKVSFTAPSVQGQREVILLAQAVADTPADSIGYVEGHGTGTPLGDPIEVQALTQAFRASTDRKRFCALGSVKSNVGHLDAAAGITGFIKAVLALEHGEIPPSLHFATPHPEASFSESPFYVPTRLTPWPKNGSPRRAGVSSFGIGGTNVHIVVEEAPDRGIRSSSKPHQLLGLSAKSRSALQRLAMELAERLEKEPYECLADVAFTLQNGRREQEYRLAVVAQDAADAARQLRSATGVLDQVDAVERDPLVYLLFPGAGTQYPNLAKDLYESEPVFRETVHRANSFALRSGVDLLEALYGGTERGSAESLRRPSVQFPVIAAVEYAIAQLLISCGIRPHGLIGHSLGEYTAACVSGVLELEDLLRIVIARGRLFERVSGGATLNVQCSEAEIAPLLPISVSLACINGPANCAVSGPADAVTALEERLAMAGIDYTRIHADVAAHSAMLDVVLDEFRDVLAQTKLRDPTIPYVSNVTGAWITPAEATSPEYWRRHMRQTVRFADGLNVLLETGNAVLIEAGPGQALSRYVARHPSAKPSHRSVPAIRNHNHLEPDTAFYVRALGQIWSAGIPVRWEELHAGEQRCRVELPSYPFEPVPYWIEAPRGGAQHSSSADVVAESWRRAPTAGPQNWQEADRQGSVLLSDMLGGGSGHTLPLRAEALRAWLAEGHTPNRIGIVCNGPQTLVFLQQLADEIAVELPASVAVIRLYSQGQMSVLGVESRAATEPSATVLRALQMELAGKRPGWDVGLVDLPPDVSGLESSKIIWADLAAGFTGEISAYRGRHRWVWAGEPVSSANAASARGNLRENGRYRIEGGRPESTAALAALLKSIDPNAFLSGAGLDIASKALELRRFGARFELLERAAHENHPSKNSPTA